MEIQIDAQWEDVDEVDVKKRAMNIRGIDEVFYNDFKQAVYKSGCKNVKEAVIKLMGAFIINAKLS
jgi:hypothetical protein